MKATHNDINLDNAVVIMRIGILDENLNWIPADEEDMRPKMSRGQNSLLASGVAAIFASFLAVLAGITGVPSSLF